ncbi:hypothetical protein BHE74_00029543, partial [Ensete ventricosum]
VAALAAQLGELLGAYLPSRGTPLTHYIYSLSARRYTLLLVGPPLHSFGRETADALNYSLSAGRYTLLAS